MESIEEIRKILGIEDEQSVDKDNESLHKEASNSIVREIDEYLSKDTLSQYCEQIEKEAGAKVPAEIKMFIAQCEANGVPEEKIINFVKEKMNHE